MLSIIICSANTRLQEQVKQNIADTIGIPYELLIWDNQQSNKGICEVYNTMAQQASFPYICFMHEDVLFTTKNWGTLLTTIFRQDEAIGLIGVAGSKYKSKVWSGWYCGHNELDCMHLIHRTNGQDHTLLSPVNNRQQLHEVVCIDGVFIVARKQVWDRVRFDEGLLKGFHLYDIDFSLRASKITKVVVTMQLPLIHITAAGGDYSDRWVKETMLFHTKKAGYLPGSVKELSIKQSEQHVASIWLDILKLHPISFSYKMKWIWKQHLPANPVYWYGILKFLLYRPLGLKTVHAYFKK
jgi:hypothetical protein